MSLKPSKQELKRIFLDLQHVAPALQKRHLKGTDSEIVTSFDR